MLFDHNELRAAETGLVSPVVTDEAFAARRSQLHRAGKENPEEKVAALLMWLRRSNQVEGRSADVISDFWRCGTIAEMMGLSIEDMNRLLRGFEAQGLIETKFPSGLLLLRVNELEMIADGVGRESPALELPKAA
jgi:CRP-like cAMP-binding protein